MGGSEGKEGSMGDGWYGGRRWEKKTGREEGNVKEAERCGTESLIEGWTAKGEGV